YSNLCWRVASRQTLLRNSGDLEGDERERGFAVIARSMRGNPPGSRLAEPQVQLIARGILRIAATVKDHRLWSTALLKVMAAPGSISTAFLRARLGTGAAAGPWARPHGRGSERTG